jgi:hypothetical protein
LQILIWYMFGDHIAAGIESALAMSIHRGR